MGIFIIKISIFIYGNCPVASKPSNNIDARSAFGFDRRKLRGVKHNVPFVPSLTSA